MTSLLNPPFPDMFEIRSVRSVIDKADQERCLDCSPAIYLLPNLNPSQETWIIYHLHDVSCPLFRGVINGSV